MGSSSRENNTMPKYVIEREISGAGSLTQPQLESIARTSCEVLNLMGPQIQWVKSYVTDDRLYCIYIAPNAAAILEHAAKGGFPTTKISEVLSVIDPSTAEAAA